MYEVFLQKNTIQVKRREEEIEISHIPAIELVPLLRECGGISINKGLYRIHTASSCIYWGDILNKYFPAFNGNIFPFGFDWLGRQYCINTLKKGIIAMLDPATIQGYELEHTILLFHNRDLVEDRDEAVSEDAFTEFINELNVAGLAYNECIANKVPLFLGGKDEFSNYELADMEVYWDTQYQIYLQVKDLPPGTKINSVKFE